MGKTISKLKRNYEGEMVKLKDAHAEELQVLKDKIKKMEEENSSNKKSWLVDEKKLLVVKDRIKALQEVATKKSRSHSDAIKEFQEKVSSLEKEVEDLQGEAVV